MSNQPTSPESSEPAFLDELPPGAQLPDRVNHSPRERQHDLQPGETDAQARKRLHDAEFTK